MQEVESKKFALFKARQEPDTKARIAELVKKRKHYRTSKSIVTELNREIKQLRKGGR